MNQVPQLCRCVYCGKKSIQMNSQYLAVFFASPQVWTPITFVIIAAILIHISWSKCTAYTAMAGSYDYFI